MQPEVLSKPAVHAKKPWTVIAEVDTPHAFDFPCGMVGFPEAKRYIFLRAGEGSAVCMQCVDHPEAAFLMAPWDEARLGPPPSLKAEEQRLLGLKKDEVPMWLLVLNPFSDPDWVFANLRAPVAINAGADIGMQCIQADPDLPLRFCWMRQSVPNNDD